MTLPKFQELNRLTPCLNFRQHSFINRLLFRSFFRPLDPQAPETEGGNFMFNKLVESESGSQRSAVRGMFFGATAVFNALFLIAVFVWSLFSFDLTAMSHADDLAFHNLVAPVALPDKAPPVSEEKIQSKTNQADAPRNVDLIKDPVENINNPTAVPKEISAEKSSSNQIRENVPYIDSDVTRRASEIGDDSAPSRSDTDNSTTAIAIKPPKDQEIEEIAPQTKPIEKPARPAENKKVSKGVVNGLATYLPKPVFPAPAKQIRAAGAVNVQVTIDINGNVTSATAVSGHPLLRTAAVQAARQAKFTPTKLSDEPVVVTGVIVYNFVQQ